MKTFISQQQNVLERLKLVSNDCCDNNLSPCYKIYKQADSFVVQIF